MGSTYRWSLIVPPVAATTPTTIEVEAHDAAGNMAVATSALVVEPLLDPEVPVVAIVCPSAGALLAPGTSAWVTASASDNQGLLSVEFFLGDSTIPVASFGAPPYRYHLGAPSTAREGDILRLRVVATDYGLRSTEALLEVRIVEGDVIRGSRTITPGDTTFEGRSLIVASGTVTLDGAHSFRDLLVLDGAAVNHRKATPAAEYAIDVQLERDLFVACEGAIDVSGLGYLGGARGGGRAFGYGNSIDEGANYLTGASHGGRGGSYDGSSQPYGNLFEPRAPGGGAGGSAASAGSDGGGVARVALAGNAVIDGAVRANGAVNLAAGAAGGSVRISAAQMSGAGLVEANGALGGAGGRIAMLSTSLSTDLGSRVRAWGGQRVGASFNATHQGAAGTVYMKRAGDSYGELVVDNRGLVSAQWTELPAVGEGIVDSVTADSLTDVEADFRSSLVGVELQVNGDPGLTWPIAAHAHHGQTLTVDVSGHPFTGQAGDVYSGLYRFDRVRVLGAAKVRTRDAVALGEPAAVEAGSTWSPAYLPPAMSIPELELLEGSGGETLVNLHATLERPAEENARFTFTATGESAVAGEDFIAATGSLAIPYGATTATIPLRLISDLVAEPDETLRIEIGEVAGLVAPELAARITIRDDDGAAHCASPELVRNGDAEEPLVGGQIPGWTAEGTPTWLETIGTAASGSQYFEPRASACPRALRQDIAVDAFAAAIDGGALRCALSGYVQSLPGSPSDATEIEVEFRDSANATALGSASTGAQVSLGLWSRLAAVVRPPVGTRFVRLRLIVSGSNCGSRAMRGYFDAISLAPFDFASLAVSDATVLEGTGGGAALQFPVALDCANGAPATIHVATAGNSAASGLDFTSVDQELTFTAGETQKIVTVAVTSDVIDETDEALTLALSSPAGGFLRRPAAIGTILDDDTATLSVADVGVVEGTGGTTTATVGIALSTPSAQTVTVTASTAAGSATAPADFAAASSSLTFVPGDLAKSLAIAVVPDAVDENNETLFVRLTIPVGAAVNDGEAVVTISDDDDNHLTIADVAVSEGTASAGTLTFVVRLSSPAQAPIEVQFHTEDLSASATDDYQAVSGTLTIPPGMSSATIDVVAVPDATVEPTETFRLLVTGADGASLDDPEAVGSLLDDDLTVAIGDFTLAEGNSGLATWLFPVTLNASAPQSVSIDYLTVELSLGTPGRAVAPGDFVATSGTIAIPLGSSQAAVSVQVRGDLVDEVVERFLVRLANPVGVRIMDGDAEGSIRDDEPPSIIGFSEPSPPGTLYDSGVPLTIRTSATDIAGVASVTFELDGAQFVDSVSPYQWATVTPVTSALTTYTIRATAVDGLGNSKSIQTTIRVRASQVPPTLHPELVSVGFGVFGPAAIGQPGAVTDPTDPPLDVKVRNLASGRIRYGDVAPDGSFSVFLEGYSGDSFELVAIDRIGLESVAMTLGPLFGDDGRVADLGFGSDLVVAERQQIAVCDCSYVPPSDASEFARLDLRLFDISSPLAPVLEGSFEVPLSNDWQDPCPAGGDACRNSCSISAGIQPCYNECYEACAPGDSACTEACWPACGGAIYEACSAHCDTGSTLCGPPGACADAAEACLTSCTGAGAGAVCVDACAAFADTCAAAPPVPGCLTAEQSCTDFCYSLVDVEPCYGDCAAACAPEDDGCFDTCYLSCGGARMEACVAPCTAGWSPSESDLCSSGVSCAEAASSCSLACQSAGGNADCTAACALFAGECATDGPPPPLFYRFPFTGFAFADGAAAMTQGPVLRIVDVRNPAAPVLVDANQTLTLLPGTLAPGNELVEVRLAGGYAFTVERLAPNRFFVVDVHDPAHPRRIATTSLNLGEIEQFEIADGKLHVLRRVGTNVDYFLYALGEPGEILAVTHSASEAFVNSTPIALRVYDEVATFLRSSDSLTSDVLTFHAGEPAGASLQSTPLVDQICYRGASAALGDQFVIGCDDAGLAVGTLD
ncbi:MAG: Calx-beta domain-containing protein, partial [Thermoanaerobaculia bacterium]